MNELQCSSGGSSSASIIILQVFYYQIYCNVEEKDIHRAGGVRDGAYIGKKSTVYELSF